MLVLGVSLERVRDLQSIPAFVGVCWGTHSPLAAIPTSNHLEQAPAVHPVAHATFFGTFSYNLYTPRGPRASSYDKKSCRRTSWVSSGVVSALRAGWVPRWDDAFPP